VFDISDHTMTKERYVAILQNCLTLSLGNRPLSARRGSTSFQLVDKKLVERELARKMDRQERTSRMATKIPGFDFTRLLALELCKR